MIHTRRGFIGALGAAIAAPAIVRVANIMPVRTLDPDNGWLWLHRIRLPNDYMFRGNSLLTIGMISRASIQMFMSNNALFLSQEGLAELAA
jgi:hypothetical protein